MWIIHDVEDSHGGAGSTQQSQAARASVPAAQITVGMEVEARFEGRMKWFKGTIMNTRSDGTYDIKYEDGDLERRVKRHLIRVVGGASSGGAVSELRQTSTK